MKSNYRTRVYERYVSAFKATKGERPDYAFTDSKLLPLLEPWVRSIKRSAPCVDLGCGNGNLLHALATLGFTDLHGVDFSAEQVALARHVATEVEIGDARNYLERHPDGHFHLITVFDVIEHLTRDEILDLVDLVALKLARGGVFIAHCPNADSPMVGQIFAGDLSHETLLNPASAALVCALAGLENFEAIEHLGASRSWAGRIRTLFWRTLRCFWLAYNLTETGSAGSGVLTRNFAFKATAASAPSLRVVSR